MGKTRLEAFSDGVLAIIITIMVLELKVPHEASFDGLRPLLPIFLSYVMSFVFIAIYWGNHHHLFHLVRQVNGRMIWLNAHLLFWLSLIPFVTGWMGENNFAAAPTALYGIISIFAGFAYRLLQNHIVNLLPHDSKVHAVLHKEWKNLVALSLYALGILMSYIYVPIAVACYVAVSVIYFIPDRRIESAAGA